MKIKKMAVLIPALVLLTAGAMAQYTPPQYGDEANSESRSAATVEGCLSVADGSDARYTLTDASGEVYRLTGDTDRLQAYVGQTIRVRGINSSVVYTPGAMSEGTDEDAQATLSVRSFRRISGVCQGTSNNP
jgi:hypothetical protein